jgi:MFS superfamily sulfate permease-like transporter
MTPELFLLLLLLLLLGWLIWQGSKPIRAVAAFIIVYGILRALEVRLFGNGFGDFVRSTFRTIANAFSNLANANIVDFAPLLVTMLVLLGLAWLMHGAGKTLRAIAGFILIYIVLRIIDAVAFGNGFGDFVTSIANGLSAAFGNSAGSVP